MDIELQKEQISFSAKVSETSIETTVESDIIVPDTKPDINKILQVDAMAKISGFEVQNERMLVYGSVSYQILYMPEGDGGMRGITAQAAFTDIAELKGITQDMTANVDCDVSNVEFKVLNGRKLSVKSVIESKAKVYEERQTDVVTGAEDGLLEKQQSRISFVKVNKDGQKSFTVSDKLIIPSGSPDAKEILKINGRITDQAIKVINNKIIVKGDVSLVTVYTDEADEAVQTVSHTIPFTEILEVDGVTEENMSHAVLEIKEIKWQHEVDEDGEGRVINAEVEIQGKVVSAEEFSVDAISDCYSVSQNVEAKMATAVLEKKAGSISTQIGLKDKVFIGEEAPKIGQIYDVVSKAYLDEVTVQDQKVTVKGVADTYLCYISEDSQAPVYSVKKELEFSETLDCPGAKAGMDWDIDAQVSGVSYALNDMNSAEIRCNVLLDGMITEKVNQQVITDLEISEREEGAEKPASITLYFVQESDSLWDIAKRYSTTTASILEANGIKEDTILTGKRLIVPKYRVS